MTSGRVEGFLPSTSGMKFTNHFPSGIPIVSIPLPIGRSIPIGDASNGVCGGMVYAAMDLFLAEPRLRVPDTTTSPDGENPLTRYVTRRLVDSFALERGVSSNVARYLRLMSTPDRDSFIVDGVGSVMAHQEWPKVKRDIDAGRPSPLGLVAGPARVTDGLLREGLAARPLPPGAGLCVRRLGRRPADPPRLRPERPAQRHHDDRLDLSHPEDDTTLVTERITSRISGHGTFRAFFRHEYYKQAAVPDGVSPGPLVTSTR